MSTTVEHVTGTFQVPSSKRRVTPAWEKRYARKLLLTDLVVVVSSLFTAQILRYGFASEELEIPLAERADFAITYTMLSVVLALAWMAALSVWDTRSPTVFGTGPTEYKRVARATIMTFGSYAIVAFALKAPIGRGYLLIALPIGILVLLFTRWFWRKRLHRRRLQGLNVYRTLVVGERSKVHHVAEQIFREGSAGFRLVAAVTERGTKNEVIEGLPVVADYSQLIEAIAWRVE